MSSDPPGDPSDTPSGGSKRPSRASSVGPRFAKTLAGRYELAESLGAGATSRVHRALDLETGEEVAVKLLSRVFEDDATQQQRFVREAELLRTVVHPNVVAVRDTGYDGDESFLVMEFAGVDSLRDRIRRAMDTRLPVGVAVDVALTILDALGAAHAQGIVHRDVKPENVLFNDEGELKLIDFGLSRAMGGPKLTRRGTMLGTPGYMAPEQIAGGDTDARTDVYGVAATLHDMLLGEPPIVPEDPTRPALLLQAVLHRTPELVSRRRDEVPEPLAEIIRRALAKHPDQRFMSATEMRDALVAIRPIVPATSESEAHRRAMHRRRRQRTIDTIVDARPAGASVVPEPDPESDDENAS